MLDEVSALAHKLGDVFDVSGLFMLVRLNGNIQLVARSTSASIDVAKIAERFGGGGHSRAAAALIRDGDLSASRQQFIPGLGQPGAVHPVSQVMEAGSVTVSPGDSLHRLQRLMIEHNWGQVPVVDPTGGQIIGSGTRTGLLETLGPGGRPCPGDPA